MYSLCFLPIVHITVVGVLFAGLGLFFLAPFISGAVLVRRAHGDRRREALHEVPFVLGLVSMTALLCAHTVHVMATRAFVARAVEQDGAERRETLRWLRWGGDEETVLDIVLWREAPLFPLAFYELVADELFDFDETSIDPVAAASVYHAMTGREHRDSRGLDGEGIRRWAWRRPEVAVGPRLRDLAWTRSTLDAAVDVPSATAYLEWTFEVEAQHDEHAWNTAGWEGQFQVRLPPGGVVSRATLWVDGVPREATFTDRMRARRIYDNIVKKRKDPLLVSHIDGRDHLVEVFPVQLGQPARRLRIGVTAPLDLTVGGEARLALPTIVAHNCAADVEAHTLRVRCSGGDPQLGPAFAPARGTEASPVFEGELREPDARARVLRVSGEPLTCVWTSGPGATPAADVVVQTVEAEQRVAQRALVVVLDGGARMRGARDAVDALLATWPVDLAFALVVAGDDVHELAPLGPASPERLLGARDALARVRFVGGVDASPALARAVSLAREAGPDARVLWVHGNLPLIDPRYEPLIDRFTADDWSRVTTVDALGEENALAERSRQGGDSAADSVPRLLDHVGAKALERDLVAWVADASSAPTERSVVRRLVLATDPLTQGARAAHPEPASDHVRRLAVAEAVEATVDRRNDLPKQRAAALAVEAQLVTALTSALVLETDGMVRDAGLQLPSADVPVLPEPELVGLALIGLAALGGRAWVAARAARRARADAA